MKLWLLFIFAFSPLYAAHNGRAPISMTWKSWLLSGAISVLNSPPTFATHDYLLKVFAKNCTILQCIGNAGMALGLGFTSASIALRETKVEFYSPGLKYTLCGFAAMTALIETFKQGYSAYRMWGNNNLASLHYLGNATIFATTIVLPSIFMHKAATSK